MRREMILPLSPTGTTVYVNQHWFRSDPPVGPSRDQTHLALRAVRSGGRLLCAPGVYHRRMPTKHTIPFRVRELWIGTEAEYAEARRHVRKRIVAAWARAFRHVPITLR